MPDSAHRSPHPEHDLLLIAEAADRDASAAAQRDAERQIAACDECAQLASDLRALTAGLATLPRTASIPAGRDFRISPERARTLRQGGFLRQLLRPFAPDNMPSLRPIATTLTGLGVAGLLFAVLLPSLPLGFGASGAAPAAAPGAGYVSTPGERATVPGALDAAASPATVLAPGGVNSGAGGPSPKAAESATPSQGVFAAPSVAPPASPSGSSLPPLTIASIVLLVAGIVLFGLRGAARRFG